MRFASTPGLRLAALSDPGQDLLYTMSRESERQLRITVLITSMSKRLRPVCESWPQDVFDAMIQRLAAITVKYESISLPGGVYDNEETQQLIADMRAVLDKNQELRRQSGESTPVDE